MTENFIPSTFLDYAIFELPNARTHDDENHLCLANNLSTKGDTVYAFGHPQGRPLAFHSNGRMYLPYRVRNKDALNNVIEGLMQDIFKKSVLDAGLGNDVPDHPFFSSLREAAWDQINAEMKTIKKSYIQNDDDQFYYLNHFQDFNAPNPAPPSHRIALDLSGGDSGTAIYSIEQNQCVIGLLSQGEKGRENLKVSWNDNEVIIPISAIMADIESNPDLTGVFQAFNKLIQP